MTRRHVHIDPIGGLAGDMFLGAALEAGLLAESDLQSLFSGLALNETIEFRTESVRRGALTGLRVEINSGDATQRNYDDIRTLLDASELSGPVRKRTHSLFRRLAEAEAEIHGVPVNEVHFHEVGAVDSIADFVGAAGAIENARASWSLGPVPVGNGTIDTSHGTMPVPAPATSSLLQGFRVIRHQVEAELVTPTGATILRHLQDEGLLTEQTEPATLTALGYGAGRREDAGRNNVLRLVVFSREMNGRQGIPETDRVVEIVCDIDDRSPETLGYISETLMSQGALDVVRFPVYMKKGRLGTRLSILAEPGEEEIVLDVLFREGLTLGVRISRIPRNTLERVEHEVQTCYGPVRVKIGRWKGKVVRMDPEYEDCRELARKHSETLRNVVEAARKRVRDEVGESPMANEMTSSTPNKRGS